jgi:hypothetical protein
MNMQLDPERLVRLMMERDNAAYERIGNLEDELLTGLELETVSGIGGALQALISRIEYLENRVYELETAGSAD